MSGHKPTTTGAAVAAWGEAVELVEEIYVVNDGEVDDGAEAAERMLARLGDAALEKLARFIRFQVDGLESIERERERLAKREDRVKKRRAWAESQALRILGEAKKRSVGAFEVKRRKGRERVAHARELDLSKLPAELVRITPEKVVPESRALDKTAAKAYLKSLEDPESENLPISGVWIERGPDSVVID